MVTKALVAIAASGLLSLGSAVADSGGDAGITFWEGGGVTAEAHSFTKTERITAGASSRTNTSYTSPGTSGTTPITTSGATIAPQESFDPLDAPAPCTRRRIGGPVAWDYCNPSPAPDAIARRGGGNPQPPPPPSPEELAAGAVDRAIALAPTPELEISPGRTGLTGLDSYFWLADPPETITATAAVPGLTVIAEARPVEFVWDFGDGNDKVTHDPGRPWTSGRPGSISHLYETKGDYDVGVDVIWEARWAVAGGAWTSLGFFSNSDSRPYPVQEMIAMLVRPR